MPYTNNTKAIILIAPFFFSLSFLLPLFFRAFFLARCKPSLFIFRLNKVKSNALIPLPIEIIDRIVCCSSNGSQYYWENPWIYRRHSFPGTIEQKNRIDVIACNENIFIPECMDGSRFVDVDARKTNAIHSQTPFETLNSIQFSFIGSILTTICTQ